jgi:hypothetical protein
MIPEEINPPHEDSTVVTVFRCVRRKATARAKAVVLDPMGGIGINVSWCKFDLW